MKSYVLGFVIVGLSAVLLVLKCGPNDRYHGNLLGTDAYAIVNDYTIRICFYNRAGVKMESELHHTFVYDPIDDIYLNTGDSLGGTMSLHWWGIEYNEYAIGTMRRDWLYVPGYLRW